MATFIALVNFTEQGLRNIKDTPQRAKAFQEMAIKCGAKVKDLYWTQGPYDVITIVEAPDETIISALMLSVSALGNVRGQTLRAFSGIEIGAILQKMV